jgi:hypothetical protein
MKKIINVFLAVVIAVISIFAVTLSANADTVVKLGDIDNNGKINTVDYILVKRECMGTFYTNDVQRICADCDRNEEIDAMDYILIKRVYMGTFTFENADIIISDSSSSGSNGPTYEDDGYYDEVIKP